jgi:signal transduction histidine kinase
VTGLDWFENFVPKRIRDDMKNTFHHLIDGDLGRFENFESSVMTMNGQERIVLFHNAILDDKNGVVNGILFSGTDMTERKRIEDELLVARKLESVGILAGGIAHDFNNLLNAILGYISLAKMNLSKDDWIYKLLDESEKASVKAGMLTRRLITFSEGGRPVITEVSVPEIIRNMDCASLSPEGSVSCKFRVTGDSWKIRADEGQIEQVIGNMLANAREAMPAGGDVELLVENVVVTADDGLPLADGKYVRFSVKDTGAGIPPENLPKIFDPYFTTKELGTKRGVRLGLAICRSIVMKHH